MVPNRRNGTYFILRARLKKEARRGGPKPGRVTGSSLPGSENANEYFKHRAPEFNAWAQPNAIGTCRCFTMTLMAEETESSDILRTP